MTPDGTGPPTGPANPGVGAAAVVGTDVVDCPAGTELEEPDVLDKPVVDVDTDVFEPPPLQALRATRPTAAITAAVRLELVIIPDLRRRRQDVALTSCGLVSPLRHEGSQPMTVWLRLLTPLSAEPARRFKHK